MIPFKVSGTEFYNNIVDVKNSSTQAFLEYHTVKINPDWDYRTYQKQMYKLLCIVPRTNKYIRYVSVSLHDSSDNSSDYINGMTQRTRLFI